MNNNVVIQSLCLISNGGNVWEIQMKNVPVDFTAFLIHPNAYLYLHKTIVVNSIIRDMVTL